MDDKQTDGITAVILTRNEEIRIRRCLDSLQGWVDEIVLIDDHSSDGTVKIAEEEYGAKVVRCALDGDFARQRNAGIAVASRAWILQLDADEVVTPETAQNILKSLQAYPDYSGFNILRRDCVFDTPLTYRGSCAQLRLIRKGAGLNKGNIHEEIEATGPIGYVAGEILHYNLDTVASGVEKNNFYTEIESAAYLDARPSVDYRFLKRKILFKTIPMFYKHYVKNKAYRDGPHGFVRAVMNTLHPLLFWLKVLEKAVKQKKLKE